MVWLEEALHFVRSEKETIVIMMYRSTPPIVPSLNRPPFGKIFCCVPFLTLQASELETMLREFYGDQFSTSPNAILTLKRINGKQIFYSTSKPVQLVHDCL